MAAGKFDLAVFLGSVGAEDCTQDLLQHGVDTLDQLATLTQDKLREWNIYNNHDLSQAITKAQRLARSSDAVVQEELLVSDTNLILEKKDWGLSISVGQAKGSGGTLQPVKGCDVPVVQLDVSCIEWCHCILYNVLYSVIHRIPLSIRGIPKQNVLNTWASSLLVPVYQNQMNNCQSLTHVQC